jgi:catechol 2,3-dioxygenase-like lactoylglutathione lyase family enzyme
VIDLAGLLGSADVVAFIASGDLDRSRSFYGETLGLDLVEQNDFACVFATPRAMLRVTAVPEVIAAGYTVLGWDVPDIREAVRALKAASVRFYRYDGMHLEQDEDDVWTAPNGDLVAWFADPDGHVLSLTQFATAAR